MTSDVAQQAMERYESLGVVLRQLIQENGRLQREVKPQLDNKPKLTRNDVNRVLQMKRAGVSQAEIAASFAVNPSTISRLVRGIYH